MEYIQGLSTQTSLFLYSLGFGFLLGVLYDVFRIVRMIVSNNRYFVVFMDVLYFFVCGVLSFFFILVVDEGKLRVYTLLGEALGWTVYYFSLGAVAMKVCSFTVRQIKRLFSLIFKPAKFILRKIRHLCMKIIKYLKKSIRKSNKKSKFILQKQKGIVYNLYSYFYNYKLFKHKGNKDGSS